jgi:5'-3' exonuclease
LVPLVLAGIGFWFTTQQQDIRQDQIEQQRAKRERELEEQRAQAEALQAYLDEMTQLLLEKDLRGTGEASRE